jgi:hypothetical protein
MRFADGKEETRTFTIVPEDDMQTVDINREDLPPSRPSTQDYSGQRAVTVTTPGIKLPVLKKIVVVDADEARPADSENYSGSTIDARSPGPLVLRNMLTLGGGPRPFREEIRYGQVLRLPSEGKYDIWWQPASGRAVLMVPGFSIKERKLVTVSPESDLGLVRLNGKGLPKPKFIVLTPVDDGDPVQVSRRYGTDMVVPKGRYDLWIKLEEGGAQKLIERGIDIQPGRMHEFD